MVAVEPAHQMVEAVPDGMLFEMLQASTNRVPAQREYSQNALAFTRKTTLPIPTPQPPEKWKATTVS